MTTTTFTVDGAIEAAERGALAEWVRDFLASDGSDNAVLGHDLYRSKVTWYGPIELDFDELHRLAGPPDQPTLERLTQDDLERADDMADSVDDGWEPPPLVVTFKGDHLVVEDGNHRIEGLRRAGRSAYWAVVGFNDATQQATFFTRFG